jgi:hypothetical protein
MYRRRKHNACLNCGAQLDSVYNYCPICGQENTDTDVSIRTLVGDFFDNYLSFDSRFGKTIKPFLFKPGFLTNEFIAGRRASYMHPIRLYLIMSLLYFFAMSIDPWNTNEDSDSEELALVQDDDTIDPIQLQVLTEVPDSLSEEINNKLSDVSTDSSDVNEEFWILTDENWEIFKKHRYDREMSDQQVLDSLNTEEMNFWEIIVAKQMIRVGRSDEQSFMGYVEKNLPLMMFFLLPVFALILKVLYYRQKHLYIKDLVFAIHLHCFAYFVFGASMIIYTLILPFGWVEELVSLVGLIWFMYYWYKAMRVVYEQKWFKTSVKMILLGGTYSIALLLAFVVELIISLMSY